MSTASRLAGQHDIADLPRLLECARAQPHALVTGVPRFDASVPPLRFYGRYLTHFWVWVETLSFEIRDSMCGFRVYPLSTTLSVWDEGDVGRRLDWIAVDHHNTGHPHTHIVVRGRDARMKEVVIARDYLTHGLREAAEELVTQRLGPRRTLEIAETRQKQVGQDRWTGLDREIEKRLKGNLFEPGDAASSGERFERSLLITRARHLETHGLAEPVNEQS